MSNGNRFNMYDPTLVAHKTLPFGTKIRVTYPVTMKSLELIVSDRGPFKPNRELDLSWAAAKALGTLKQGVATVKMEILR